MYAELRAKVLDMSLRAYRQGLFAGTSGNLSLYDRANGVMAITPSSLPYEDMKADDIVIMKLSGEIVDGKHRPSSEAPMHAAIYQGCDQVSGVVHTHSPYATALAVNRQNIPVILIEMLPYFGGDIKTAEFRIPGTPELGRDALPYLKENGACLLANHGVLTVGETIEKAYSRAVYTEDAAKIYCIAKQSGEVKTISDDDIKDMKRILGW